MQSLIKVCVSCIFTIWHFFFVDVNSQEKVSVSCNVYSILRKFSKPSVSSIFPLYRHFVLNFQNVHACADKGCTLMS